MVFSTADWMIPPMRGPLVVATLGSRSFCWTCEAICWTRTDLIFISLTDLSVGTARKVL